VPSWLIFLMYKLLLILRYLRRKLAPMFAALAVTLCTAMVIIVISVMGGFLDMMRGAARKLTGDVIIRADLTGFPDYESLLATLHKLPEVAAATPTLRAYGLVNLEGRVLTVEVIGIDPKGLDEVTGFGQTLQWTRQAVLDDFDETVPRGDKLSPDTREYWAQQRRRAEAWDLHKFGMEMKPPAEWGDKPGVVLGIAMSNRRDSKGQYHFNDSSVRSKATLTVVPLSHAGVPIQPTLRDFTVVNEFKSGLYEIDANRVYVSFDTLQKMLHMDAAPAHDPETGEPTGKMLPARATEIMVKGKEGVPLEKLRDVVDNATHDFLIAHPTLLGLSVQTWEESHATFLGAVEKEKMLLTILFAIISVVAVAMIAVIFYMIVLEKTRDIGVLRAIGASRRGVASIFLGYGLAIGIVGAGLGLGLAAAIVLNINEIQDKLTAWFGVTVWNPEVYYFDKIPSKLNTHEVAVIVVAAVLASVIGSLIPAIRAGQLDPVESLRYE